MYLICKRLLALWLLHVASFCCPAQPLPPTKNQGIVTASQLLQHYAPAVLAAKLDVTYLSIQTSHHGHGVAKVYTTTGNDRPRSLQYTHFVWRPMQPSKTEKVLNAFLQLGVGILEGHRQTMPQR